MRIKPKTKFVMNRRNSFTLIEILFVIVIVGILTALAVPGFRRTFENMQQYNFAKDMRHLSIYLQSSAISMGKVYCLNIDAANGKILANYAQDGELKGLDGRFGRTYAVPLGNTVSIEGADKQSICFYPDGYIDNATIIIENQRGNKVSLIIKGLTGDIKIQ